MKAVKPKFSKNSIISKNKKTLHLTNLLNSKIKSISFNKQSRKKTLWSKSPKASKKSSEPKSTKNSMNSEPPRTITLLRHTTKALSITKIHNLTTRLNWPKSNSTSPFFKPEDSKNKSISAETNSSVPDNYSIPLESKTKCLWTQYRKFPEKSLTGKNSTTKTSKKSKLWTGKDQTFKNNSSSLKPNSSNTMKNSSKDKNKFKTMKKKLVKEILQFKT